MASGSYAAGVLSRRAGVAGVAGMMHRVMSTAANPQAQVDFLKGERHRKHPGLTNLKTLRLPEELQTAARSVLHKAEVPRLTDRARTLKNFLWSRKRPVEDFELRKKALSLEKALWGNVMQKRVDGDDIDEEVVQESIKNRVLSKIKKSTYHWRPMKYDEEIGMMYMAARLAGCYAAVTRALNEIKKRDGSFAPHTLLNFGSGLGSVVWASHSYWGDTLKEMVCVDSSGPMNILAERLLKGDNERAEPCIKHVYFRQFLPVSPKVQFDLVVAAYTLSELPGMKEREEAVFTLWRKTNSYLVLVENGTREGHQMLMEARDILLKKQEKTVYDARPASVFAPCPHELMCPKLAVNPSDPCNFDQPYYPLPRSGNSGIQTEKFSYLILTRTPPAKAEPDLDWGRLIAPVLRRTRHVHCKMCCADGQLQHLVLTKRKNSRDIYRCARSSDWGDQMPVIPNIEGDIQEIQNDDQSD